MKVLKELARQKELDLPSFPPLAIKLVEAVKEGSFEKLAKLIQLDPALSSKVLKLANSPFFSHGKKVEDLKSAIAILGTEMLQNIALSFILIKHFTQKGKGKFDFAHFWRRSLTAAIAASLLAEECGLSRERLYLGALLMDFGILVMYHLYPDDYIQVLESKKIEEISILEAEKRVFGITHPEVGKEIIAIWKLPSYLESFILYHHNPDVAPDILKKEIEILYLADRTSSIYFTNRTADKYSIVLERANKILGLSFQTTESLIDKTANKAQEIFAIFDLVSYEIIPYSLILAEANKELKRININYALLLQQLKEEKERAERLAKKLKESNIRLREIALKDALTTLYNRHYFQKRLEEEIERSFRYNQPLSIAILDIDFFKNINDKYGHLCGDKVLKTLAEILREETRKSDILARYGGEEFVILLPSTNLQGAKTLAERLRQKIEKYEFSCEKYKFSITVSFGVASLDPKKKTTVIDFLSAADKALYISKRQGRNRTTAVQL
ncbi:diguanylate cyclase [Thermodesulfatator indicus DSM 15286]|uniref:diguanylate cyclase n=1 Tax=Thermodesulfatator indicus (strain DSM 15286 / JCM 11887 / CIR29812) TaxID=667014 RepID=F8ACW7_THEID|nr:GGDEF domain-containing protein [Thermodesulfatator indicus]AEH44760.1 diguanylate cyclase [Thermodesulfatator indicus DSM 15286]